MLIPLSNAMNMRVVTRTDPRRALIAALLIDALAGALLVPQALSNPTLVLVVPTLAVLSLMAGFIMANATAMGISIIACSGIALVALATLTRRTE